jgi:protein tyrosine phosphatase (PTP) superfamily phosphohydrolase (DUF442 family)
MIFTKSQRVLVGIVLLAGALQAAAQSGQPAKQERGSRSDYDVAAMFKMHLNPVSAEFTTAAQPTNEILKEYKDKGYKAVINFREPHEHDSAGEIAATKQLGLRYYNIPVVYPTPKFEQATEFLKLTDDPANWPTLIHCTVNIRASSFFMIRRMLRDGWTFEAAHKEAEKAIAIPEFYQKFVKDYVAQHKK